MAEYTEQPNVGEEEGEGEMVEFAAACPAEADGEGRKAEEVPWMETS